MILAMLFAAAAPAPSPRATVTAMFAAFNRHDAAALARLYAPDAILTSPDHCRPRGHADVARSYAALFAELPDIVDTIDTMIVEGDTVAVRFTATSKSADLTIPIQAMITVRNGLITHDDALFDAGGKPCAP